jgi:ribosomal protein S17E
MMASMKDFKTINSSQIINMMAGIFTVLMCHTKGGISKTIAISDRTINAA